MGHHPHELVSAREHARAKVASRRTMAHRKYSATPRQGTLRRIDRLCLPTGGTGKPQLRIRRPHPNLRQSQLLAHDIRSFDDRDAFVIGNPAAESLTPETAIGGDHQPLRGNELERTADQPSDVLRWFHHGIAVVDYADADLLVGLVLAEKVQVLAVAAGALERNDIRFQLQ